MCSGVFFVCLSAWVFFGLFVVFVLFFFSPVCFCCSDWDL